MLRNMCGIGSDFQIVVARFSGLFAYQGLKGI
jgi:hypothetical protein